MNTTTLAPDSTRVDAATLGLTLLGLQCPVCARAVGQIDPRQNLPEVTCSSCGFVMKNQEGIWNGLAPTREERFEQFIREYQTVRAEEGRGSSGSLYYLALPYKDLTGRNTWQWKIRSRTFRFFERKVLAHLEGRYPRRLDVLDIGAGNGWMSYRLALRGHRPVAVDLLAGDYDGLGAARHYFHYLPQPFARFRAEMGRLPFTDGQFDLAIFNASFHYSEDYDRTLREALRCLRRPGHVCILDSPFYQRDESGQRMLEARRAEYERKYGFRSDSIASREYLTESSLQDLARRHQVAWKVLEPWYGVGWALRPFWSRLRRRREPAKFYVAWGSIEES